MPRILAIDDCRELAFAHVLCRTVQDGITALKYMGPWDSLYLDHDMGAIQRQFTESGVELNGYHVLCFLEENPEFLPKAIRLVTDNASARPKMQYLVNRLYSPDEER